MASAKTLFQIGSHSEVLGGRESWGPRVHPVQAHRIASVLKDGSGGDVLQLPCVLYGSSAAEAGASSGLGGFAGAAFFLGMVPQCLQNVKRETVRSTSHSTSRNLSD